MLGVWLIDPVNADEIFTMKSHHLGNTGMSCWYLVNGFF